MAVRNYPHGSRDSFPCDPAAGYEEGGVRRGPDLVRSVQSEKEDVEGLTWHISAAGVVGPCWGTSHTL